MKRNNLISRTSVKDIVFLVMSNTGMTQEQAAITVDNIITYMKQHTSDPISKMIRYLFGGTDRGNATLN